MPPFALALQTDAETEDLGIVGVGFQHWESEVQRDRGRSHGRDGYSQTQARGNAEIVERDVLVDRAEIDERDTMDHVVGGEREQVLNRVEELEVATDLDVTDNRRSTTEIEAAERGKAARIESVVNRCVVAGEAKLG